jgi:hypothetical protein
MRGLFCGMALALALVLVRFSLRNSNAEQELVVVWRRRTPQALLSGLIRKPGAHNLEREGTSLPGPNGSALQRRGPRHAIVAHLRGSSAAGHVRCKRLLGGGPSSTQYQIEKDQAKQRKNEAEYESPGPRRDNQLSQVHEWNHKKVLHLSAQELKAELNQKNHGDETSKIQGLADATKVLSATDAQEGNDAKPRQEIPDKRRKRQEFVRVGVHEADQRPLCQPKQSSDRQYQ